MGDGTASGAGRGTALVDARRELLAGRGVLVVGERGAGRSHFVDSLLDSLDPPTRRLVWTGEVEQLDGDRVTRLENGLRDASLLPVLTASTGSRHDPGIDRLLQAGLMTRVDLEPMTPSALLRAVENFLGGRLDSEAAPAFVPARPGGDLVVLQGAVRAARARRVLQEVDGLWSLTAPLQPDEEVRQLLLSRLDLPEGPTLPAAETVLDLVALAPGISLDRLERLVGVLVADVGLALTGLSPSGFSLSGLLELLERRGTLEVVEAGGAVRLRVHDPVIELQLTQTISILRRRRFADALVDVLGDAGAELAGGELLALALHGRARGRQVATTTLLQAARVALQAYRPDLARQLAADARAGGGGFEADLISATADAQLGLAGQALELIEAVDESQLDPAQQELRARLRDRLRERVDDPHARWAAPRPPADAVSSLAAPRWDSITRFTRYPAVRDPDASRVLDPTVLIEGEALTTTASVLAMRGDLTAAGRALEQAEAILAPIGADLFVVQWTEIFVRAYDEPLETSIDAAVRLRNGGGVVVSGLQQGRSSYLLGALRLMGGRAGEAVSDLRTALLEYQRHGLESVAVHARPVLAAALALGGLPDEAEEILAPALTADSDPYLNGQLQEARGWLSAVAGDRPGAVASFTAAAASHRADGFDLEALVCLVHAARAGGARAVLPDVDALAGGVEGRCAAVFVRYARALARFEALIEPDASEAGDASDASDAGGEPGEGAAGAAADRACAEELDTIAEEAAALGFHNLAAEAASRAVWLHATSGSERAAAASARRAATHLDVTGQGGRLFLLGGDRPPLSRREREIAALAASGASNRKIAERLVLSVRTIETHLLRVYRKLGIRTRAELPDALGVSELPGVSVLSSDLGS